MRVVAKRTLRQFWQKHPDAQRPLTEWYTDVRRAAWSGPAEIKAVYRTASFISNNRVVFNIGGNKYRLIVRINYRYHVVYVRFIGTHAEYDRIDAETV